MVYILWFIKLLAVFSLLTPAVQAQEALPAIDFKGYYDFSFSGIPFGRMVIDLRQNAVRYEAEADVKTTGIARVFVQHQSHTTSTGNGKDSRYGNVEYESRYSTRGKKKYARISKRSGIITADRVEPADNRATRPAVALKDKSAAFDPLAMGLAIRSEFIRTQKDGRTNFTLDFYDGRRLTRASFTVGNERVIRIGDKKYPVHTLSARRKPIAGYTASELARMKGQDPELIICFSHDEKLIPIYLEVPVAFGVATATLRM